MGHCALSFSGRVTLVRESFYSKSVEPATTLVEEHIFVR